MRKPNERAVLLALGAVAAVALVLITIVKADGGSDEGDGSQAERQIAAKPTEPEKSKPKQQEPKKQEPKKPAAPSAPEIVVRNGEPIDGIADLDADAGEKVRFRVSSDVADEVHIHGYDISKPVAAGGSVSFDFVADIEGIFEIELEERAVPIAELQVNP